MYITNFTERKIINIEPSFYFQIDGSITISILVIKTTIYYNYIEPQIAWIMGTNSGYRVNDDGSVTRIDSSTNSCQGNNNSGGGSSNNNGCVWWTIVAIIAVLIIVFSNINSSDQTDVSDSVDSVEIDNPIVVEETDAVATVELDDDPPEATYCQFQ